MYKHLLATGQIGKMQVRNHVIMSPTETHFTNEDGTISWAEIEYYRRRAKGGAGLIVTHQVQGNTKIDPIDPYPRSARLDDDAYIPMMAELTEAVHLEGAKIGVLLSPGGGAQALGTPYDAGSIENVKNVAPGTIECPVAQKPVRQLTVEEIHKSVEVFGKSCGRAKRAGFDAIFIHAHCGYLIAEFLSPFFNNRKDEYGGNLENRARFLMELIASCRENVGPNFPIVVRLAGDEYIGEEGRTIKETVELAKMMEAAGVDGIDCGGGMFKTMPLICPTIYHEKGIFIELAEQLKAAVNIPVITQGRLHDPDLINKIKTNDIEGIRRCVSCNHCIGDRICGNLTIRCALNALAGREHKYGDNIPRAEKKKNVVVIGAGPAGCEAAYQCALKGHEVNLYDKENSLCVGEQFHAATVPDRKEILLNIPRFYKAQFEKLENVTVHLNCEVTATDIEKLNADTVVLATGALPVVPGIPGVKDNDKVITAVDLLNGKVTAKGKVLVAGGGQVGVETAHTLRNQGFEVGVIEMQSSICADGELMTNFTLLPMIAESGIETYVSHKILKVNEKTITVLDMVKNEEKELEYDTFILALGMRPVNELKSALEGKVPQVLTIGSAAAPGNIKGSVEAGFNAALRI